MPEVEISSLVKKLILNLKTLKKDFKESEEFLKLEARLNEINKISDDEKIEELIKEEEEIETNIQKMYDNLANHIFKDISQEQIVQILFAITPDFIEENHINFSDFGFEELEEVIVYLFNNLKDENHKVYNSLLINEKFIMSIDSSLALLKTLINNTNDEEGLLNFIREYSKKIGKADVKYNSLVDSNVEFGSLIETVIKSENYSESLKNALLSDKEILAYISSYSLVIIMKNINLPKNEKFQLLFRNDIFEKLSDDDFSSILGNFCQTYEEFIQNLYNDKVFQRVNIVNLLMENKLSPAELKKLLLDNKISKKVGWVQLGFILKDYKMDFESRKNILFDDQIFSKLNGMAIAVILTSKYINSAQRQELLSEQRIFKAIIGNVSTNYLYVLLEAKSIPVDEKVALARDSRFSDCIRNESLYLIMSNSNLSIDTATDALFDKRIFYKLIGEQHDEYNPNGISGPYKYDKYEYVKKLYERNPNVARTLSYRILKDEILDLGFDFIEKVSRYNWLSNQLASAYENNSPIYLENMIKTIENSKYSDKMDTTLFVTRLIHITQDNSYFNKNPKDVRKMSKIKYTAKFDASSLTKEQWKILTEVGLRDMSVYYNGIESTFLGNVKDEIDITLNILPDIESIEDINNYTERRMKLCDDMFKSSVDKKDLDGAKNSYFNKYFSINIQEAQEIARMYGSFIHNFDNDPTYDMQAKYVEKIMKVLNIDRISDVYECYNEPGLTPISFDEMIYMDQSIRQAFSKQVSDSMYKTSGQILDMNGNTVQNTPKYMEFPVNENGVKKLKKVLVYEPGFDFKMLIHSTDAYGKLELINNNYFDSWNKNGRKTNHGICCSLISNDNMGMAEVKDVLFGFDSWDQKSLIKSAPYDIYSSNDDYDLQEGRPLTFMTAQGIINNTRHSHNEQLLERFELREERRTTECQNIQPSYVIICSDMPDNIKQKALKCSEDMGIPIVYIDKEKIVNNEVSKLDSKIKKIKETENLETKLDILEQILLSHENNRSGLKATNKDWVDKYFPPDKITNLFAQIILEIQKTYEQTGNINDYYNHSYHLMEILDRENQKFKVTMESIARKNFIDIPVDDYEKCIMQFINQDFCKNNLPKLESIADLYQHEKPDLAISQAFSLVEGSFIHNQVEDILNKKLYPGEGKSHNIGHIERVIFLSHLIGKKEFIQENGEVDIHAVDLLTQCAKYHDCGRVSDTIDRNHGKKSADKMGPYLLQAGYDEKDIRIMQIAVEYHEEIDDDFKFERICRKYGLESSETDLTKKIANCLKDADALDRTRFSNRSAGLDAKMLRFDISRDLIPVAEKLNRCYENYDKQQFKRYCQYLLYQQQLLKEATVEQNSPSKNKRK